MSVCAQPFTSSDKWYASILAGILFVIVSSSYTYNVTNRVTTSFGLTIAEYGCPNLAGLFLHTLVFIILLRLLLQFGNRSKCGSSKDKWIISTVGGLLFLVISSPFLYDVFNTVTSSMGMVIANDGCPNNGGLILMAIFFMIIVRILMR